MNNRKFAKRRFNKMFTDRYYWKWVARAQRDRKNHP